MTDKPTPTDAEIDVMVAAYLGDCGPQATRVYSFARAVLAKWGQSAQAAEPVAVVVPCYTPSGKRVALYSAKQDLPIGTKLYAAPQPSPTPQADSVLEDAARYRHLRDCNSGSLAVIQITGTDEDDWLILTEDDADAAIDADRKQGGA